MWALDGRLSSAFPRNYTHYPVTAAESVSGCRQFLHPARACGEARPTRLRGERFVRTRSHLLARFTRVASGRKSDAAFHSAVLMTATLS